MPPKIANMESMKKENMYRTTVTCLRPGSITQTYVLKVWSRARSDGRMVIPYRVHISKDHGYILKMERDYLSRKITSIFP